MSKRKRDTVSDSDESDIFRDPKRKSSKKPREKSIREKNSSEDDPDDPEPLPEKKTVVSESENISESESDEDENETAKNNTSKSATECEIVKGTFFSEELSSDDEVFTFQCPDNFNIETLLNVEFDMNEISQTEDKHSGNIFNLKIDSRSKSLTCALPSRRGEAKLVNLPVCGHIVVERDIQVPSVKLEKDRNKNIEFPKDLKVRHPLLGVDWEEHIRKSDEIIKKFNSVDKDDNIGDGEKRGSDRKKKKGTIDVKVGEGIDDDLKNKSEKKVKSHKKKKQDHDADIEDSGFSNSVLPKKKKKA